MTARTSAQLASDLTTYITSQYKSISDTDMRVILTNLIDSLLNKSDTGSQAITGPITVGGTLGVTGATTLASLGVTGAATVGTTLGVTGATTLTRYAVTPATVTIASGVASATNASVRLETQSGDPLDTLETLTTSWADNTPFILHLLDASHNVRIAHGTGNIQCPEGLDLLLDTLGHAAWGVKIGSYYIITGCNAPPLVDTVTLASGIAAVKARRIILDTESGAPSDDLVQLTGGYPGQEIVISIAADTRDVVVKHSGNIRTMTSADVTLGITEQLMSLVCRSTGVWSARTPTA